MVLSRDYSRSMYDSKVVVTLYVGEVWSGSGRVMKKMTLFRRDGKF
jgi:hypothetical protein